MKSIYQKISIILFIGFLIQIILIGTFYRQVIEKHIIADINQQENKRQTILQQAMEVVQKYEDRPEKAKNQLDEYAKKYNTSFVVKNIDGDSVLSVQTDIKPENIIQEQGDIKISGKISYIVYGYFPAKISNLDINLSQRRYRIAIGIIIFILAFFSVYLIYRLLANPLKKLSKAINNLNYGNTVIDIPYYGEDEFGLLCRNFEAMGNRLKKSEDVQQELVQAISHDTKTPLTSILGFSKRLSENKVEEERKKEYYDIIYRKAKDLKNIVLELEDYGNIKEFTKYNKVQVNFYEYISKLIDEIRAEILHGGSRLFFNNNMEHDIIVYIDRNKLKRVFWNIVENSIKYAGEQCSINITISKKASCIYTEICDNGVGIPEDHIKRIFDRFYRVDTSRSRDKGGTGLGLAICKDIIVNHGGEILARNGEKKGLCISFTLPIIN
jgi:signal transduction histidine kinase